jgi:hypothetical protein
MGRRVDRAGIGIALLLSGIACGGGSGEGDDRTPATETRGVEKLRLDAPFPALDLTDRVGQPASLAAWRGRWVAVALVPRTCADGFDHLEEWRGAAAVWGAAGLTLALVTDHPREARGPAAEEERIPILDLRPPSLLVGVVPALQEPTHALIDPAGVVRYVDRPRGTLAEHLRSLFRSFHYLSAADSVRVEIARRVFPNADSLRLGETTATPWLGTEAYEIGLSRWYGVAVDGGRTAGYAFPIEVDTGCDTCEPLYLIVGVDAARRVTGVTEIEPIVVRGSRVFAGGFLRRLAGVRDRAGLDRVPRDAAVADADEYIRRAVGIALEVAAGSPAPGPRS